MSGFRALGVAESLFGIQALQPESKRCTRLGMCLATVESRATCSLGGQAPQGPKAQGLIHDT